MHLLFQPANIMKIERTAKLHFTRSARKATRRDKDSGFSSEDGTGNNHKDCYIKEYKFYANGTSYTVDILIEIENLQISCTQTLTNDLQILFQVN